MCFTLCRFSTSVFFPAWPYSLHSWVFWEGEIFFVDESAQIDFRWLPKSCYWRIGVKLRISLSYGSVLQGWGMSLLIHFAIEPCWLHSWVLWQGAITQCDCGHYFWLYFASSSVKPLWHVLRTSVDVQWSTDNVEIMFIDECFMSGWTSFR